VAHIREFEHVQPTFFRILCQGGLRFELLDVKPGPYGIWQGRVNYLAQDPEVEVPADMQVYANRLGQVIASAQKQGVINQLPIFAPYQLDQCGWLANRYAEALSIRAELKQQLLGEMDPLQRLKSVIELMQEF
jgi:Lon protease-like protein